LNSANSNLVRRRREALACLEPVWRDVLERLAVLFPTAAISGRLRPDIYNSRDGVLARDSAGIRLVVRDAEDLEKTRAQLHAVFSVTEERDYRLGRPESPYYRAVHLYLSLRGFEIEVQLRTRRHHRLAAWAHDRLLLAREGAGLVGDPRVIPWLVAVADAFDQLDTGQLALPPPPPPVLLPHLPGLGLAPDVDWCQAPISIAPLFSHATKDERCVAAIVADGAIRCPDTLPDWVPRFSGFADSWAGRTSAVMLSLGFGYLVDNANMCAAFLFSEDLVRRPTVQVHKTAEVFRICCIVVEVARQLERDRWLEFFHSAGDSLLAFDNPYLKTSFRDYMLQQFGERDPKPTWRDVWGPSAFSEGVLRILYLENENVRQEIEHRISAFRQSNRLSGGGEALDYVRLAWSDPGIYRTPIALPLSDQQKKHLQVLVPRELRLDDGACVGLCLAPKRAPAVLDAIGAVRDHADRHLGPEIPVYCGALVAPLAACLRRSP
jgi:hypothetical protein